MRKIALALALACSAGTAHGEKSWTFVNGNELLLRYCSIPERNDVAFNYGFCFGYISAIADAMGGEPVFGYRACITAGVKMGQVQEVAVEALNRNPATRHKGAQGLVAKALAEAFPCPDGQ